MSSVNISQFQYFFRPGWQGGYDIDGNGKLDRPEIAKASLNLMGQEDPQTAGRMMATFVQGGSDGQGLLPDFNNDNALSYEELAQFAGPGGQISSQNFQETFGNRYQPGGGEGNIAGLQQIGHQNLPQYSSSNPYTFTSALGSLGIYGPNSQQSVRNFMNSLYQFSSIYQRLGWTGSGGQ
jgi:hypothetical protein